MTDWKSVVDADFAVPAHHVPADQVVDGHVTDGLVRELSRALADPDPLVRDGEPYAVLATWITRGVIAEPRRLELGDEMAARFADPRTEARTFAPLVLAMLVRAGDFRPGWVEAFERWYPAETDLRGHDATLGWLHAVAHGADLLGAFGLRPEVAPTRMLDLAAARLTAPTDHVFDQMEDDRLAKAIALVLTRDELAEGEAVGWLAPVADRFGALRTPASAPLSNCLRTLRQLYVLADRGLASPARGLRHREAVKAALGDVLDRLVTR